MTGPSSFGGDRPIQAGQDKLGYEEPARRVASAILKYASSEGFVLGLEGNWGSGKSSFANLIVDALRNGTPAPEIVRFSPWLISSRNGLLDELFREIASAAEKIEPVDEQPGHAHKRNWFRKILARSRSNANRRRLTDRLHRFSAQLVRLGALANLASVFLPGAAIAGATIGQAQGAATSWASGSSLEGEKEKLIGELRRLSRQIVVFVDDLDRLEPMEAAEVVRLVRAVADFPNVVYVLCYSRDILANSLENALRIKDGSAYIEKIVQVTFGVPKPEDFDLRRMFREDLLALFPQPDVDDVSGDALMRQQRLGSVIDLEGGRALRTPRDVVRVLNALRLYAGPIVGKIDLADVVWLQLVRLRDTTFYNWIESYVYNVAAVSGGAHVAESDANTMATTLSEVLTKDGDDIRRRLIELRQILPGISWATPVQGPGPAFTLFHNVDQPNTLAAYVANKRLGSPQHFRFYFALSKPSGALEDDEFKTYLTTAESDPAAASLMFARMAAQRRPQGGSTVEAIMDRLNADALKTIPENALPGIVQSLADAMDIAAITTGPGEWGRYWIWNTADHILRAALARMAPAMRASMVTAVFDNGKALGWLSSVLRDEIFAHGRFGTQTREPEARTLADDELDLVVSTLRRRYRETDPTQILGTPHFLNLLFGWLQSGQDGKAEVIAWVSSTTASDNGMLSFLDKIRSWTSTNGQVNYPIKRENLSHFADFDATVVRVETLAKSADPEVQARASNILSAMLDKRNSRDT